VFERRPAFNDRYAFDYNGPWAPYITLVATWRWISSQREPRLPHGCSREGAAKADSPMLIIDDLLLAPSTASCGSRTRSRKPRSKELAGEAESNYRGVAAAVRVD